MNVVFFKGEVTREIVERMYNDRVPDVSGPVRFGTWPITRFGTCVRRFGTRVNTFRDLG